VESGVWGGWMDKWIDGEAGKGGNVWMDLLR
jgi:hypothetical protein